MLSEAPVTIFIIIVFWIWFFYKIIKTFNNIQKIVDIQEKLYSLNLNKAKDSKNENNE